MRKLLAHRALSRTYRLVLSDRATGECGTCSKGSRPIGSIRSCRGSRSGGSRSSPRASVEREFGRLKNEWALLPLRVHAIEPVLLQADLAILANLACALGRACAIPLAP